ncbi:MAG: hypothetical protein U0324_33695 [Polyangiales bacterium]
MGQEKTKKPGVDGPPPAPKTFTSPPKLGAPETWEDAADEVDAVPDADVLRPRIDLAVAAESALAVCDDVRGDAALYARFLRVAESGEFDPKSFPRLQRYANAAWQARRMQVSLEGAEGGASVPAGVLATADALYGRMHSVVTYYLGNKPEAAPFLANLAQSPGHRRAAVRLLTLADLYRDHRAVVSVDTVNYRATDEKDARDTAAAIVEALRDDGVTQAELWAGRAARAWTLLSACYAEVQAVGQFLLRRTPDAAKERFPSLIAEARTPAQPRKPAEPAQPAEPAADPAQPAADPAQPAATPRAAAPKRKRRAR